MKKLVKLVIGCVALLALSVYAFSQTPAENLHKYWLYRERLSSFMLVGNCAGCSIPAIYRERYVNTPGVGLEWSDATQSLGLYISVLALEYRLLKDNDQDLYRTTEELYYALETINRLDVKAERYWDSIMNGNTLIASAAYKYNKPNGFFIRDDVDTSFLNQHYQGKSVWQHLNSSRYKLPDSICKPIVRSGFTVGLYDDKAGPREESIDQVILLLQGLLFTSKYVDTTQTYHNLAFMDGTKSLVKEAKNIANRIVNHISSEGWWIKNPVMPNCVQGVYQNRTCSFGAPGGGDARSLSLAFVMCNQFIQQGAVNLQKAKSLAHGKFPSSYLQWKALQYFPVGEQDFKVISMAALSNVWGVKTPAILARRAQGPANYYEHIPLMYKALYNGGCDVPDSIYLHLLNAAPLAGSNAHQANLDWSNYGGGGRVICGPNCNNDYLFLELPGLDYMFYFNLYAITHPNYLAGYSKTGNSARTTHAETGKMKRAPFCAK